MIAGATPGAGGVPLPPASPCSAVEAIRYYGGRSPSASRRSLRRSRRCAGYPVASIFDTHDLPDYETYDSHSCPWCRQGKKIDALVNSFGYSSL